MPDKLGPHLLGRHPNKFDSRDWTPDKLHAKLGLKHDAQLAIQREQFKQAKKGKKPVPAPPDATLDKTIRQAVTDRDPFVTTWKGLLALWKWIKSVIFGPPPGPTPTPTPTPTPVPPTPTPVPPTPVPPTPTPTPTADGPLWESTVVLDQGNFGTCVGNAWAGWGDCAPIMDTFTETDARAIYYEATCIGGACDPTGQNGSSTRDGVKAMQARGKLTAYAFATTLADIEEWLDNHGPVVIGINWTDSMFHPDPDGTVHYTGPVVGGHEIFIRQNVRTQSKKRVRNSWGSSWGPIGGDFFLTDADLTQLLADGGDACLAAEV